MGAVGRPAIDAAREMLRDGLDAAEVCSLFTHVAVVLSKQRTGLSREEWLALCEELYDGQEEGEPGAGPSLTAPGGDA